MKLNATQLASWKKNNNISAMKFILVYGPDEAGVHVTVGQLIKDLSHGGESAICRMDFKAVKEDISLLADELNSVSLFGELKIVVVEGCAATLSKELIEFLKEKQFAGKLVLQADDLKPTSNLRKLAEAHAEGLSIACYKEDAKQVAVYVRGCLQEAGAKFDDGVIVALVAVLPPNRMMIAQELEKLLLYTYGRKIEREDVAEVVADAQEVGLDDLCLAVILNDAPKALKLLKQAENTDVSFMLVLRVLQRYCGRVLEALANMEGMGLSADAAVAKLAPPVFFKQKDGMVRVCKAVGRQKMLALIADLVKLELDCKRYVLDEYMLISSFISISRK